MKQVDFALELIAEPFSSSDHHLAYYGLSCVERFEEKREEVEETRVEWVHELIVELLS